MTYFRNVRKQHSLTYVEFILLPGKCKQGKMDLQPAALIKLFNKAPLQASMACLVSDIDMDTVDITTPSDKNY